jgi:protein O-GlcNAc transferase
MKHEIDYNGRTVYLELDDSHIEGGMNNTFYEHKMLQYIERNYTGTFIDAGAYIGNHSIFFALFCNAKVHAFEPVYTRQLIENVEKNEADVTVYPYGLGKEDSEMGSMDRSSGRNPAATSLVEGSGINVRTLDSFNIAPDLIKIDVENMEVDVLKGAEKTIRTHKPALFVELVHNLEEADIMLADWGYTRKAKFNATPTYHYVHKSLVYV